jgi:hypothetical protein
MVRVTRIVSCALFLATILGATTTYAGTATEGEDQDDTFIFYWENDVFSKNDRYYTNGLKLLWVSGPLSDYAEDKRLPGWSSKPIRSMPVINPPATTKHVAFLIGQQMFTPQDIENPALLVDDRPYAGWTYAGIALHSNSESLLDSFELDIGMVGPESYAREVQEKVHDLLDSAKPRGWDHQLNNEVGLVLVYERKWRIWQLGFGNTNIVDLIPHLGMALGNVRTYANAGGEIRLGLNLPDDFGTALIRPAGDASMPAANASKGKAGVHLFVAVDGRSVLQNIFLDGNTFTDSHAVDKEPFVADIMAGVSVHFNRFKITYSHVYKTKEFETQQEKQIFGSVSVAYLF